MFTLQKINTLVQNLALEPIPFGANRLISATVKHKEVIRGLREGQRLTLGLLLMICYTTRRGSEYPEEEFLSFLEIAQKGVEPLKNALLREVEAFLERQEQTRVHGILHTVAKEFEEEGQIVFNLSQL